MPSLRAKRQQARDIARRAGAPGGSKTRCLVPGCRNLTQRSQGNGLSDKYCKGHIEHHRRHGSYWRRSYLVHELEPYRRAARRWLKDHQSDLSVQDAIYKLHWLVSSSGRSESAYSIRGYPAKERARIALARLREVGKQGEDLFIIDLTIKAITSDIGPRADPEFTHVQIAKMAHRLGHTITRGSTSGFTMPAKHARPEGHFMRVLGEQIMQRAETGIDRAAIREVIALAHSEHET